MIRTPSPPTLLPLLLVGLLSACGEKETPPAAKSAPPAPVPAPVRVIPEEKPVAPPVAIRPQPTAPAPAIPVPAPPPVPQAPAPTPPSPVIAPSVPDSVPVEQRLAEVRKLRTSGIREALQKEGFRLGDPVFIRVFKESLELELWLRPAGASGYRKWKTWPIAAMSGELGPKTKEGDRQAPEGFYQVTPKSLNPRSNYHLSFNIGYPNAFDQAHQRTGSFIMVHGKAVSIGCFAMTDPVIEEIYLIADAALQKGQPAFGVHVFPFRMTSERMQQAATEHPGHLPFWLDLRLGYTAFERTLSPPSISVQARRYVVTASSGSRAS